MIGRQLRVDLRVRLPVLAAVGRERAVAVVHLGQLLLDDVGLDRDAEVVRLAGQVGGEAVVDAVLLERRVAQVAPEHGEHAELVRLLEGLADLDELPAALLAPEVDRRADGGGAHLPRLARAAEHRLVVLVRVGQELVVVQLDDERDLVRPAARHRAEHADRRGDGVAAALVARARRSSRGRSRPGSARSSRRRCARCPGRPGRMLR